MRRAWAFPSLAVAVFWCSCSSLAADKPGNVSTLISRLRDQGPKVVGEACTALGDLRAKQATVEVSSVLAQSGSPAVQAKCAFALGRIGSPESGSLLRSFATDTKHDPAARIGAIRAISVIEGTDPGFLVDLLGDSNGGVRSAAAYVLCQLQVKSAIPRITEMLNLNDSDVKEAALTAVSVWPEAFSPQLAQMASTGTNAQQKILALSALDSISPGALKQDELQKVARLLDTRQPQEVVSAASQLLNESSLGRSIAATKKIVAGPSVMETPPAPQPVRLASAEVIPGTSVLRALYPAYIIAAILPLLIAMVQGKRHRAPSQQTRTPAKAVRRPDRLHIGVRTRPCCRRAYSPCLIWAYVRAHSWRGDRPWRFWRWQRQELT